MIELPYLIVAIDYALNCHGTCPTCVLNAAERAAAAPVTTPARVEAALRDVAGRYGRIGTLALGIGRGNVLTLGEDSIGDIVEISRSARNFFDAEDVILEISSSLIGKIEPQIDRARRVAAACQRDGVDARFVIVGNTALSSAKYWANLDHFLRTMQTDRGNEDGAGDILQLALSLDCLPEVEILTDLVGEYHFPVNLTWAPAFDRLAGDERALERLGAWLADFYSAFQPRGLDASLVTRVHQALERVPSGIVEMVHHVQRSADAVIYVAPDGRWHQGLFTILAEMDPVRFDPQSSRSAGGSFAIATNPGKDISRLMRNPACSRCPFLAQCVASGAHQVGLITLRRHPAGTSVCPSGLRPTFEEASRRMALEHVA